jgi:DNA-binding transcriptional LysR family regulator
MEKVMELADHLDKLAAFKIIVETGTLGDAAIKLNLSQPSLTRLVQTLENASGEILLHRSRHGVLPTEAGELLYQFTKISLKNLQDLQVRMKNPTSDLAGLIHIGSYESLAEYLWPKFLPFLKKTHPELKVAIRTNGQFNHNKMLESGQIDLLLDAEPRITGDFTSWNIYEDRFNFYGKKDIVPSILNPDLIENLTLIYCPAAFDSKNKRILNHLEEAQYFFKERIELDSFPAVATFAKNGNGIAVLPERLAEPYLNSKQLVLISLKGFSKKGFGPHNICATVRLGSEKDMRIKLILKLLREWFKT